MNHSEDHAAKSPNEYVVRVLLVDDQAIVGEAVREAFYERIAKKDARNNCAFYSFRTTVEKDTAPATPAPQPTASSNGSHSHRPTDARKALIAVSKDVIVIY